MTRSGVAPESLAAVRRLAESLLPGDVWDFIEGGADGETALAANRAALDRVRLLPRVLAGLSEVTTAGTLLGSAAGMPVAVAPMAYQRLAHPDGESAVARAARDAGVPFVAAMLASATIEEMAELGGAPWLQLYWLRDRGLLAELVARAERAGYRGLFVTVDVPVLGNRLRDVRNRFTLPADVGPVNLSGGPVAAHDRVDGDSAVAVHTSAMFAPDAGWQDLAWLRERTALPLAVKGVLDPRDARHAVDRGADAVVVSNHGGRQFDGAAASVDALPAVVEAVGDRAEVLLDGGVRSGTDVLRALALGASGALLGRPVLWGLATGGESGVARVLEIVRAELARGLTLAGCADPAAAAALDVLGVGHAR
ncbi:alpha-hydroxy-acid oxidizing enzyme [Actinocatenispora thailandica]|uniref:Alpha-hydroxy-acid oxidizing enzyme n=1 Tax=Actinocatenispora thailandica TaxID=227318 RepID=A0A7R7DLN5_9ACTN|nr:alpha-hydroxy acid oxidase [Actinocatenispora thailandica]BCJ33898.1 alpha-hydroxy-acid oxidizing enzyme [Actinocatenispora thailandica]